MLKMRPRVAEIDTYVAGDSEIPGRSKIHKLSSNENPFGTSDAAVEAYKAAAGSLNRYPPSDHSSLKRAIEEANGLDRSLLVCGAGSDEILAMLCQAFGGPGCEVVHTAHAFLLYKILAQISGAKPVEVEEPDRRVSVDAILAAISDRTRLVFIANPSNPTGAMVGESDLSKLAGNLPEQAILVLDGAYAEYADDFDGGAELVRRHENVVMTRTFSKVHGLAALRVGYGFGPAGIIKQLEKIRPPFNITGPSAAAAEAAVRDRSFVNKCTAENSKLRSRLANDLAQVGVPTDPSFANFVLARLPSSEDALACDAHLRSRGILVRKMEHYKLPDCLRITVGGEEACGAVVEAMTEFSGRGA